MSMNELLREERIVLNALRKYHALEYQQLIKLLYHKPVEVAQRILKGLQKRQYIFIDEGGLVTTDPRAKRDDSIIAAFWTILQFINKIKPNAHCEAKYPSNIFFIMDNQQYEICVIPRGEEHNLNMLFAGERACSEEDENAINYILVVQDADDIESCIPRIPDYCFDKGLIMFATVGYASREDEIPTVEFFKQE